MRLSWPNQPSSVQSSCLPPDAWSRLGVDIAFAIVIISLAILIDLWHQRHIFRNVAWPTCVTVATATVPQPVACSTSSRRSNPTGHRHGQDTRLASPSIVVAILLIILTYGLALRAQDLSHNSWLPPAPTPPNCQRCRMSSEQSNNSGCKKCYTCPPKARKVVAHSQSLTEWVRNGLRPDKNGYACPFSSSSPSLQNFFY